MLGFMHLQHLLSEFGDTRILVVGDFILDEYLWGHVERISPEAPVPVVDIENIEPKLGGAGNVVNNLVALSTHVDALGVVGRDEACELLKEQFAQLRVSPANLLELPSRPTSRKTRIVSFERHQQVARIDRESRQFLSPEEEYLLLGRATQILPDVSAVIISDYAKGVVTSGVSQHLIQLARESNKPIIVDPKGQDYTKYRGATIITPNTKEAEVASGIAITDAGTLEKAGYHLLHMLGTDAFLITQGAHGMTLFHEDQSIHLDAQARDVYDVTGAGDTVVAALGLMLAIGQDYEAAIHFANLAAGIVVGKVGAATVSNEELASHWHLRNGSKLLNHQEFEWVMGFHPQAAVADISDSVLQSLEATVERTFSFRGTGEPLIIDLPRSLPEDDIRLQTLLSLDFVSYVHCG